MNPEDHNRKAAWKAQERQSAQSAFPISNALLGALFDAVEAQVATDGCDHTHRFTDRWLSEHQLPSAPVLEWLEKYGGFCDCEIVANARDHWEQNK